MVIDYIADIKLQQKRWIQVVTLVSCSLNIFFSSCTSCNRTLISDTYEIAGILGESMATDSAPSWVLEAMERAKHLHKSEIMNDTVCDINVESIHWADTTYTEGYGIVVTKGSASTTFPNIRNARCPMAAYDKQHDWLWLTCNAMWGQDMNVDWLYQIRFDDDEKAYIAYTVNPYDIQQLIRLQLSCTIDGQSVTFWDKIRKIVTVTNNATDMSGIDEMQPVWIGSQINYDLTGSSPRLLVTPCLKFKSGIALVTYNEMPTLVAPITITDYGLASIGDINEYCIK